MTFRVRVSPETCTVLGSKVKETDPRWTGLDLSRAAVLTQSNLMRWIAGSDAPYDLHLNVPWWHPMDGIPPDPPDMWYRVRAKMEPGKKWKGRKIKSVAFEKSNGDWWIAIDFDMPATKAEGNGR